ncbi:MAG TPA: M20/M25/M40 family metallo-hydrolase [Luteitalea sp.]|nr:M20/M25/M40 family metallo-hydrolase [Luteitalea sp.]
MTPTTVCRCLIALVAMMTGGTSLAQPSSASITGRVRQHRQAHEGDILRELRDLVAVPNLAREKGDIARNAALLRQMLERRGFSTALLTVPEAAPAVLGELTVPGATRTVVFYAHYDGQPVTLTDWRTPPWAPVLRAGTLDAAIIPWESLPSQLPAEARMYGRSTSDDKGPIVALLAGLDALRAAGLAPSVNLKVFLEGEEEAGSPHLESLLRTHAERLRADAWIFGDGPVHQSRQALVSFGVRGTIDLELTTYGPVRPVHSGHYGNWAPNPAAALAQLLATMRDDDGRILIEGFAERVRPLSPAERAAIAAEPPVDDEVARALALGRRESKGGRLLEAITVPALNVRGLRAGDVGERAANAVPTEAQASIDFRLVPDVTPDVVKALVETHLRAQGYHVVRDAPDEETRRAHPRLVRVEWGPGYPGYRASMDLPFARAVVDIVTQAGGRPPVLMPNMGGSLPLYLFADILKAPIITVPVVNHDNNQHAANENLRIQNLWDAIETYALLLARLDAAWPR